MKASSVTGLPLYSNTHRQWRFTSRSTTFLLISLALLGLTWQVTKTKHCQPRTRNRIVLVEAQNGAVASENKRCSEIGVGVLKEGGNAVDAAIASTLCVGVVNMFSCVVI